MPQCHHQMATYQDTNVCSVLNLALDWLSEIGSHARCRYGPVRGCRDNLPEGFASYVTSGKEAWHLRGHGEALAKGEAAPGLNKARIPLWNGYGKARRDEPALVRSEGDLLAGAKVETGITGVGIRRKLDRGIKPLDGQKDMTPV